MEELGPTLLRQAVLDQRLDLLPRPGIRWTTPSAARRPRAGSKTHQFADAPDVMPGDDADHLRGMVGDCPGVEDTVGPIAAAAVELPLAVPSGFIVKRYRPQTCGMSVYSQRRYMIRPSPITVGQ